ncbi:MAG: hypothetical protein ACYC7E_16495 [Armatimonadota bacterium]
MKNRILLTWSFVIGIIVALGHALYLRHLAFSAMTGCADCGTATADHWGFGPYLHTQDYYLSFSYALGAAFAVWAIGQFIRLRSTATTVGVAGSVTFVGILLGAGCFLIGCCGSPMLAIYASLFGAQMLGVGKPLMALITLVSVGIGYWTLSQRFMRGTVCTGTACCECQQPQIAGGVENSADTEECKKPTCP